MTARHPFVFWSRSRSVVLIHAVFLFRGRDSG